MICRDYAIAAMFVCMYRKSHQGQFMQTPGTNNVSFAICNKVCKSASGLKRHMVVHKHQLLSSDPSDPTGRTSFLCHICIKLCDESFEDS